MATPVWSLADVSDDLLSSAWDRVRENEGCAGVDAVTIEGYTLQAKTGLPELRRQLQLATYFPLPLRKIVIEKKPNTQSFRTLLVPVVRDRIAQTAVGRLLARDWEQEFLTASYAYRPGRGVDAAVERIIQFRDQGWTWVVDADIAGYFDHISHSLLDRLLRERQTPSDILRLLRLWFQPDFWDGRELHPLKRGIPQGSPISPLLANLFLTPFDTALGEIDARLIRYSDDFIVLCRTEADSREALARAAKWLRSANLTLRLDKTQITTFDQGFSYLGVTFRNKDAMIPWRPRVRMGRLVFIARPMSRRLLTDYREARQKARIHPPVAGRPPKLAPSTEHLPTEIDMPYLYITQPGAYLRKSGERFLVECDQHVLLDCPLHRLESVLLFGNVQISSQAVSEALDHGIGVGFFSRTGRFRGALSPGFARNVNLRIAQYRLYSEAESSLAWAKATVARKIANGLAVVERYEDREPKEDRTTDLRAAVAAAKSSLEQCRTLAEVDGVEGSAARAYFDALFGQFNRSTFPWPGRVKHPATDPLNALLSLGYTLLMNESLGLAEGMGLDPALGFLHEVDGNRPSLALDLMEPFRHPVVDRMVLAAVNRQVFAADDFVSHSEHAGLALIPEAFRRFLEQYERSMLAPLSAPQSASGAKPPTFRRLLHDELHHFARALKGEETWAPFAFPLSEEHTPPCPTSSPTT